MKKFVEEKFTIPLWEKFSKEVLLSEQEKFASQQRTFDRGFHLKVYSDVERTFPSFDRCKHPIEAFVVPRKWPHFAGVDPFGKNIVVFVLAISPQGIRYPVEVRSRIPRIELFDTLISLRNHYKIQLFCLEDNAAQIFIADGVKLKGGKDFPIVTRTTKGYTKTAGFATMESEFASDLWYWAANNEGHDYGCGCGWCLWELEMVRYPDWDTWDTVIACFYAREAARIGSEEGKFCGYEQLPW